jgi:hypothetical protein
MEVQTHAFFTSTPDMGIRRFFRLTSGPDSEIELLTGWLIVSCGFLQSWTWLTTSRKNIYLNFQRTRSNTNKSKMLENSNWRQRVVPSRRRWPPTRSHNGTPHITFDIRSSDLRMKDYPTFPLQDILLGVKGLSWNFPSYSALYYFIQLIPCEIPPQISCLHSATPHVLQDNNSIDKLRNSIFVTAFDNMHPVSLFVSFLSASDWFCPVKGLKTKVHVHTTHRQADRDTHTHTHTLFLFYVGSWVICAENLGESTLTDLTSTARFADKTDVVHTEFCEVIRS